MVASVRIKFQHLTLRISRNDRKQSYDIKKAVHQQAEVMYQTCEQFASARADWMLDIGAALLQDAWVLLEPCEGFVFSASPRKPLPPAAAQPDLEIPIPAAPCPKEEGCGTRRGRGRGWGRRGRGQGRGRGRWSIAK